MKKLLLVVLIVVLTASFAFVSCAPAGTASQDASASESVAQASASEAAVQASDVQASPSSSDADAWVTRQVGSLEVKESAEKADTKNLIGSGQLKTVGASNYMAGWEWGIRIHNGWQDYAKNNGLTINEQDANADPSRQAEQAQTFVTSGVDGIVTVTIDGEVLNSIVKKAVDKGIPFVSTYVACKDATVNIVVDEYELGTWIGKAAGEWAQKNFPGQTVNAAVLSMQDYKPGIERTRGMKEAFEKAFPTGKVTNETATIDVTSAMSATEAIMSAHPDIKIFLCASDDTAAIGCYQALKSKLQPDEYSQYGVFSSDGMDQAIKYMTEPDSMFRFTVDSMPAENMELAMQYLKDIKDGKEVPKTVTTLLQPITPDVAKTRNVQ